MSNYEMNDNSLVYFAYYHGLVGSQLWAKLQMFCCKNMTCSFYSNVNQNCSDTVSLISPNQDQTVRLHMQSVLFLKSFPMIHISVDKVMA